MRIKGNIVIVLLAAIAMVGILQLCVLTQQRMTHTAPENPVKHTEAPEVVDTTGPSGTNFEKLDVTIPSTDSTEGTEPENQRPTQRPEPTETKPPVTRPPETTAPAESTEPPETTPPTEPPTTEPPVTDTTEPREDEFPLVPVG